MTKKFSPLDTLDQMLWIADFPSHGAKRFPERAAIIADTGRYTYPELDHASNRFAAYLKKSGMKPGERIAYLGKNNEMFFPVLFGCLRSGVVLVPLNWRCAPAEIAFMLEDSGSRLLIHDKEFSAGVDQATSSLAIKPTRLIAAGADDSTPNLASLINSGPIPQAHRYEGRDDCAMQLYTSGTTGRPKGVMLSQRTISIARHVEIGSPDWADWSDDDIILSAMPNFHTGGMAWMFTGMVRSLTCVLTADPGADNLLALSQRYGTTRTFMVPTVVRALLDALVASGGKPPGLKSILYGASVMDIDLIRRCLLAFPGCTFGQYFGMTETSGTVTFLPPRAHDIARPELLRSVGQALPGMTIEIRDADRKRVPAGTAGEIWVNTPTTMLGYWNRADATAEALVDGWYRTGDGGYLDDQGYLYLTDRIKDMIVSGGENIYPAEVEAVLRLHPAIRDLVIVGIKDPVWGECVTAVVEWRDDQTATLDELRAFGMQSIAGFKLPRRIHGVPLLPRTATGKLQRAEVRKRLADGQIGAPA
jgi:acyl-CoA synthetase (AMP-forming)/AMP-acid ligase II